MSLYTGRAADHSVSVGEAGSTGFSMNSVSTTEGLSKDYLIGGGSECRDPADG